MPLADGIFSVLMLAQRGGASAMRLPPSSRVKSPKDSAPPVALNRSIHCLRLPARHCRFLSGICAAVTRCPVHSGFVCSICAAARCAASLGQPIRISAPLTRRTWCPEPTCEPWCVRHPELTLEVFGANSSPACAMSPRLIQWDDADSGWSSGARLRWSGVDAPWLPPDLAARQPVSSAPGKIPRTWSCTLMHGCTDG